MRAIIELKHPENQNQLKSFLGAKQYLAKFIPRLSERTAKLRRLLQKDSKCNWGKEQDEDFNNIKKVLTEEPCLAHYAKIETTLLQPTQVKPDSELHYGRNNQTEK